MSLGRTSTFIDIFSERDLENGVYTESEIQEFVDDLILKTESRAAFENSEYNELFGGDPMWITEGIGGMGADGRTRVYKELLPDAEYFK